MVRNPGYSGHIIRDTNHGVTIVRSPHARIVETVRPNGFRVVSMGRARGFVEHPIVGRTGFYQRTYVVGGRSFVRVYNSYNYRGVFYRRYVPGYYYHPAFYFWVFNPWRSPVYFSWGWGPSPWFYGGYFAPAPYYTSGSLWLVDFILAANLRAAYDEQMEADAEAADYYEPPPADAYAANSNAQITPAIRQAIADEVQRQLEAERAAAADPQQGAYNNSDQVPTALTQRVFVVSNNLDLYDGDQPCSLTPGDIITRVDDTPGDDNSVRVSVLTSKNSDCRPGAELRVQVSDLQDMANDLRAHMDDGLQDLSKTQGTKGLPPAPDTGGTPYTPGQGTPDPDANTQLQQQKQDADATEKEVKKVGPGGEQIRYFPPALMKGPRFMAMAGPWLVNPQRAFPCFPCDPLPCWEVRAPQPKPGAEGRGN